MLFVWLLMEVGLTGIEPALPKELDPKSSASASSATAPYQFSIHDRCTVHEFL